MLPCNAGFVHGRLREELSKNYEIFVFRGKDTTAIFEGLVKEIARVCDEGKTVALHGWSMGGGILLKYLASPDFQKRMSSIVAVLLYAASGTARKALPKGSPKTILYHNTNDVVISIDDSVQNVETLGGATMLHARDTRYHGNNHQCNEFVTHTVKDLRICDLEHFLRRKVGTL
jgi:dienelactone hydrolase